MQWLLQVGMNMKSTESECWVGCVQMQCRVWRVEVAALRTPRDEEDEVKGDTEGEEMLWARVQRAWQWVHEHLPILGVCKWEYPPTERTRERIAKNESQDRRGVYDSSVIYGNAARREARVWKSPFNKRPSFVNKVKEMSRIARGSKPWSCGLKGLPLFSFFLFFIFLTTILVSTLTIRQNEKF